MYGLIHSALEEMLKSNFDPAIWDKVLEESNVGEHSFMRMESYDVSVTLALIGATAKVLNLPVNDCLEAFGEYWMTSFAPKNYARVLERCGTNMLDFIESLDLMHDRISSTFPDYKPPSFKVEKLPDKKAIIMYTSHRSGLTPFVIGLINGMGKHFQQNVEILTVNISESVRGNYAEILINFE